MAADAGEARGHLRRVGRRLLEGAEALAHVAGVDRLDRGDVTLAGRPHDHGRRHPASIAQTAKA